MDPLFAVKAKSKIAESALSKVLVPFYVRYLVAGWKGTPTHVVHLSYRVV
jgi:hypothetical protein